MIYDSCHEEDRVSISELSALVEAKPVCVSWSRVLRGQRQYHWELVLGGNRMSIRYRSSELTVRYGRPLEMNQQGHWICEDVIDGERFYYHRPFDGAVSAG
jgi:hypothetical protein